MYVTDKGTHTVHAMKLSCGLLQKTSGARELDKMLEGGIIERSVSHYSNPLVVVIKKDGRVRLCLDARRINQIIIPDRELSLIHI